MCEEIAYHNIIIYYNYIHFLLTWYVIFSLWLVKVRLGYIPTFTYINEIIAGGNSSIYEYIILYCCNPSNRNCFDPTIVGPIRIIFSYIYVFFIIHACRITTSTMYLSSHLVPMWINIWKSRSVKIIHPIANLMI